MNRLDGQVAIVTGAAQGIGFGIASCLGTAGATLVLADVSEDRLANSVAALEEIAPAVIGLTTDVRRSDSVDRLVQRTLDRFEQVDILVNNAGVVIVKSIVEQTEEHWDTVLDTNLKGTFLCSKRVVPEMAKREKGVIINVSSIAAFHFTTPHIPYAASKAGVSALTRDLAYEVAPMGIRVNAIAPGPIRTPMMDEALTDAQKEAYAKTIPVKRIGRPEDIGHAAVFLASENAEFITGITLPVTGGTDLKVSPS